MNRTDQASEPSMEEILASIRNIISDDGRALSEKASGEAPPSRAALRQQPASVDAPPEEDVFDLTEEFVFPDEQAVASSVAPAVTPPTAKETRPEVESTLGPPAP